MDDNKKTNNINKNDDKKEIIVKNDLGVVSISNKIKKNNEKNQKINKKKELDEELEKAVAVYNKEYGFQFFDPFNMMFTEKEKKKFGLE